MWLNRCSTFGFEGEYFALGDESTDYYIWSDGNPIVARPFYDNYHNHEATENVAIPRGNSNSLDGAIGVSATTRFHGAGAHFLFTTCRQDGCWTDDCGSCMTYHDRFRADFVAGYRYLDLEDQLGITETLTSTDPNSTSRTQRFSGPRSVQHAELVQRCGSRHEVRVPAESLVVGLFPRVALGSTHSTVDINGSTRVTDPTGAANDVAQRSVGPERPELGVYTQNNFAVVPELDLKVGFQFTAHTRLVVGYDALYWSSVARAGEQIDRTVNPTYLPGSPVAPTGDPRPLFTFQQTGFWAQGVNVGVDCRW